MNEDSNTQIVREVYEKFGSGDIEGLLRLFHDEIEWAPPQVENAPWAGPRRGRDSVREFFSILGENEEFSDFTPTEFIAQGDKVVVLGRAAAKVVPTGRNYSSEWVHIFTLKDGKITTFKEFMDTHAATLAYQQAAAAQP
jgi:uncharacterized protein